jgi:hypothetical protein
VKRRFANLEFSFVSSFSATLFMGLVYSFLQNNKFGARKREEGIT